MPNPWNILAYNHRKGVSKKNGNAYDFYEVHCVREDLHNVGNRAVEVLTLSAENFEGNKLDVGSSFYLLVGGGVLSV